MYFVFVDGFACAVQAPPFLFFMQLVLLLRYICSRVFCVGFFLFFAASAAATFAYLLVLPSHPHLGLCSYIAAA